MPLLPIGASMGCRRPERSLRYGKISRYKDSNHKNQPVPVVNSIVLAVFHAAPICPCIAKPNSVR
jgi:hypothetical protein